MSRWAVLRGGLVEAVVLWDGDLTGWQPPTGTTCVPYDPALPTVPPPVEQTNGQVLRDRAQTALTVNATFLALGSPTTAQTLAQVQRLTRQTDALIRLLLGQLDTISDT